MLNEASNLEIASFSRVEKNSYYPWPSMTVIYDYRVVIALITKVGHKLLHKSANQGIFTEW